MPIRPVLRRSLFVTFAGAAALALSSHLCGQEAAAQEATITESMQTFQTYPFSDPDPVARMGNIYPYFRFHGYSMTPVDRQWKIVTLENPWIRVLIAPEIGGKILGAIEKESGKAFIYYNKVVKFRDIAMRGPWTSGGIEFNFGDIGHTPATATPVDYLTRKNPDGSVSCIVGALDLPSRTEWRVEIRLPHDRALFETRSFWYNPTSVTTAFYHWMNAAANADSTLQVLYPGTAQIGHEGETARWPVDPQGRDLSWYRNNAFGTYKSYHVLGSYTDWFGARWNDFGVIHWSPYTDKPGKKLWIWGLAREGEIWTGLLTDTALGNTQYVELQSGLHFNQALPKSSLTPFKHMEFLPHTSTQFTEAWFPFRGVGGVTRATPEGVLHVEQSAGKLRFEFCPTGAVKEKIMVLAGGKAVYDRTIDLQPLQSFRDSLANLQAGTDIEIHIGDKVQYLSGEEQLRVLERPIKEMEPFNWKSAYGLVVDAQERLRQRDLQGALVSYQAASREEPTYLPALAGAADLYYRKLEYDSALTFAKRALAIDAYDPQTNYVYGLVQRAKGRPFDAKDGFGIASKSAAYQTAAFIHLAEIACQDSQWAEAENFALRAAHADAAHLPSLQLLATLARRSGNSSAAATYLERILVLDPLNHFARFEQFRLSPSERTRTDFVGMVRNELPHESFMELAAIYYRAGFLEDARTALTLAPKQPMTGLWLAFLSSRTGRTQESKDRLKEAMDASPAFVFPHRREEMEILSWARTQMPGWKSDYYLALLSWGLGRTGDARKYFDACADKPDFVPFYLTRASFRSARPERALADYQRALALGPDQWRTYDALTAFYNARGEYARALEVSNKAVARFPQSYMLKFLQARTLSFNRQYRQSLAILDTLSILPSEGARFGRDAYREACVMSALDALRRNQFEDALGLVQRARLWPERLGAGRPYDVDTRLEDYLESRILKQMGNRNQADSLLRVVNAYSAAHGAANSAQHLIGAFALRDAGMDAEARQLLDYWAKRYPTDEFAQWSVAVFRGRYTEAQSLMRRLRDTRLNRSTGDQEAVLVVDVAAELR